MEDKRQKFTACWPCSSFRGTSLEHVPLYRLNFVHFSIRSPYLELGDQWASKIKELQTQSETKGGSRIHSFARVWAFFRMGSSLVAFMMLPLILSLPPMNRRWALALPLTREPKSSSERVRTTAHQPEVSYSLSHPFEFRLVIYAGIAHATR